MINTDVTSRKVGLRLLGPLARRVGLYLILGLTWQPRTSAAEVKSTSPLPAETTFDLFTAGSEGYHTFRIPVMVESPKGTLMAFCEGRKNGVSDHGEIHLLVKRSMDRGRTWGAIQVIQKEPGNVSIGNPAPTVDFETGELILAFCRNNNSVFVSRSTDDGKTWEASRDITQQVRLPGWEWYATGPSPGIQLRQSHKGRLVVPANHSGRIGKDRFNRAHMIYSDDHGVTWKLGEAVPFSPGAESAQAQLNQLERGYRAKALGTPDALPPEPDKTPPGLGKNTASLIYSGNEGCVVELPNGDLLLNTRGSILGTTPMRASSVSRDGGVSWAPLSFVPDLVEPGCHADFRAVSAANGKTILLFSNPAHLPVPDWDKGRQAMTVKASVDGGKTWPFEKLLHPGPSSYSSVLALADGTVLCLFEGGKSHRREWIRLARFPLSELVPR